MFVSFVLIFPNLFIDIFAPGFSSDPEKYLAATTEVCSLYVDLRSRRVTEFEDSKKILIQNFIDISKDKFNPGDLHLIGKLKK